MKTEFEKQQYKKLKKMVLNSDFLSDLETKKILDIIYTHKEEMNEVEENEN